MARKRCGVKLSCMVGVHPEAATTFTDEAKWQLEQWLKKKDELGIVAVGEIGMDYHYEDASPAYEAMAFIYQMGLACLQRHAVHPELTEGAESSP